MKLLFVHEYLGAKGGAETDLRLTACAMNRRGHSTGFLFAQGSGRNEEAWRESFSTCSQLQSKDPAASAELALKKLGPDLIYFYSLSSIETLAALLRSGIPVVRRVQDHALYCMRSYKYNYFTRAVCKRPASWRCVFPCGAFLGRNHDGHFPLKWVSYAAKRKELALNRRCRRLVVYSQYQKEELIRNGFEPEQIVVHVPLNIQGARGPRSSLSARNLIVFAGQIIRGKGVDVLLRALAKVRVPFECVVLGEGNDRARCEGLCARLGLSSRVKFRGFVRSEELKDYYLDASVAVVSSVWPEPFGMTGPEAMLYGLPVVAFDAGGIREWLADGETGYLVPWMDTGTFAARIEQLLQDKGLARQLGDRARSWASGQYDAERQFDFLENVFLSACQEARNKNDERYPISSNYELCR